MEEGEEDESYRKASIHTQTETHTHTDQSFIQVEVHSQKNDLTSP